MTGGSNKNTLLKFLLYFQQFRQYIDQDITRNYRHDDFLVNIGRVALALTLLLSFPLLIFPCRAVINRVWDNLVFTWLKPCYWLFNIRGGPRKFRKRGPKKFRQIEGHPLLHPLKITINEKFTLKTTTKEQGGHSPSNLPNLNFKIYVIGEYWCLSHGNAFFLSFEVHAGLIVRCNLSLYFLVPAS